VVARDGLLGCRDSKRTAQSADAKARSASPGSTGADTRRPKGPGSLGAQVQSTSALASLRLRQHPFSSLVSIPHNPDQAGAEHLVAADHPLLLLGVELAIVDVDLALQLVDLADMLTCSHSRRHPPPVWPFLPPWPLAFLSCELRARKYEDCMKQRLYNLESVLEFSLRWRLDLVERGVTDEPFLVKRISLRGFARSPLATSASIFA